MSKSPIGGHLTGAPDLAQYSQVREVGDLIFVAGVSSRQSDNSVTGASRGPTGALEIDIRAQTEAAIENLRGALESAAAHLSDVVDVTVFLVNMADYGGFNEVWNRFFDRSGPARTTVAVHQLPDPQLAVELKAIARRAR
jgi:2-aminomuconate deaminase